MTFTPQDVRHAVRGFLRAPAFTRGLSVAAWGVVAVLAGAVALTNVLSGLLFNVRPLDPITLLAIPAVLAVTAGAAIYAPAKRAAAIDPLASLRSE